MKIVFAHNVYKRHKQMIKTINNNRQFIDDDKTVLVSNGNYLSFINYLKIDNIQFRQLLRNKGHKIGALEGMITAMKLAIKLESDIIIFSHDDVYINNFKKLKKYLNLLEEKSIVIKHPIWLEKSYIMFDVFLIRTKVARSIFSKSLNVNKSSISVDYRNAPCPEKYFGDLILSEIPNDKIHIYEYNHDTWGDSEIGFYHIPGRNLGK